MDNRVTVNTFPVAARYAAPGEKIIEYSSHGVGGLIAFRVAEDGELHVDLYRHDPQVHIRVAKPD